MAARIYETTRTAINIAYNWAGDLHPLSVSVTDYNMVCIRACDSVIEVRANELEITSVTYKPKNVSSEKDFREVEMVYALVKLLQGEMPLMPGLRTD